MFARVSDNVLDDEDWGIVKLVIADGEVVEKEYVQHGCYENDIYIGMTVEQLVEWTRYDATGTHPEQYHELAEAELDDDGAAVSGTFRDFWTREEVES